MILLFTLMVIQTGNCLISKIKKHFWDSFTILLKQHEELLKKIVFSNKNVVVIGAE